MVVVEVHSRPWQLVVDHLDHLGADPSLVVALDPFLGAFPVVALGPFLEAFPVVALGPFLGAFPVVAFLVASLEYPLV